MSESLDLSKFSNLFSLEQIEAAIKRKEATE